jgi:formyltetrahydrofolate-dependent phosphoribosylglycinamide formyltransferase
MLKIAVFASGGGTNFESLMDRKNAGDLHVEFALFIGNNSKARAFERARAHGIPAVHLAPSQFVDPKEYANRLMHELESHGIELIVLAGYMKQLPGPVIQKFQNRIVNIHPALLPAFGGKGMYGIHVHEAVIASGVKVTGVTVHLADEEYDNGPIITQAVAPVLDDDTAESLQQRVLRLEYDTYWRAIEALAQGTIRIEGRKVVGQI